MTAPPLPPRPRLGTDLSWSAVLSGMIAVLVGYAGPGIVIISAAAAGQLSAGRTASWIFATAVASGLLSLGLSRWTRMPVVIAWSTPGAALLVVALARYSYPEAIGAYLLVAVTTVVVAACGGVQSLLSRIPTQLVSAMLAGILLAFAIGPFTALAAEPIVPAVVIAVFLLVRSRSARFAVPAALAAGIAAAAAAGRLHLSSVPLRVTTPEWTTPAFSWSALLAIGIPLFIVTMTAQNAAGLQVLRSFGYAPDEKRLITATGVASFLAAPFGSHAVNLSAITAAICAGPGSHRRPERRYVAGMSAGVSYLVVAVFGAGLVAVLGRLPAELVAAVAGVALWPAFSNSVVAAVSPSEQRDPALITLLATASGVSVLGVGAATWGLLLGIVVSWTGRRAARRAAR